MEGQSVGILEVEGRWEMRKERICKAVECMEQIGTSVMATEFLRVDGMIIKSD